MLRKSLFTMVTEWTENLFRPQPQPNAVFCI